MLAPLVALLLTAAPPTLACPDFGVVGVPASLGRFAAEHLAAELDRRGVKLVTNKQISSLLGRQRQAALLGCDDAAACTTELVDALGASALLLGELARVGSSVRLNLRLLSRSGVSLKSFTLKASSEDKLLDALTDQADQLAREVTQALAPAATPPPDKAQPDSPQPAVVTPPVVATPTKAEPTQGTPGQPAPPPRRVRPAAWVTLGAGAVVVLGSGLMYLGAQQAHARLTAVAPPGSLSLTNAAQLKQDGELLQVGSAIALGLGVAVLAVGGGLALFSSSSTSASLVPGPGGVALVGVWP